MEAGGRLSASKMLYPIHSSIRTPRLTVLAYDMACPRRAWRVRRVLSSVHHAKQYSVFEAMLGLGEFRGLLAEITAYCDPVEDLLAVWWPRGGVRLFWDQGTLRVATQHQRAHAKLDPSDIHGAGNFVVCYDISDPAALDTVAREVAVEGAMLQRSVYWLRVRPSTLLMLFERCSPHLGGGDRLWAYPLRQAGDLWRVGATATSVLPIATYGWI